MNRQREGTPPLSSTAQNPLHAVTWLVWALAAAVAVQIAPNPFYVAVVIAAATAVVWSFAPVSPLARAYPILLGLGATFALLRVVLTALTTRGSGDALFTLPSATLPRLLGGFEVGGEIAAAVVARAAMEGFVIVGIMAAFGAFNAVVSHAELVQAAPRAFHEPGLILTVALAFVPSTMLAIAAVREADRARTGGRVVRRGRVLRQVVPVLETGLERAIALSESMDARGFARASANSAERAAAWAGLASLLALGGAFVALVGREPRIAVALGGTGIVALVLAVVLLSRGSGRRLYRRRGLTPTDWTMILAMAAVPAAVAVVGTIGADTLLWTTDPLAPPPFDLLVGVTLAALGAPVIVAARRP